MKEIIIKYLEESNQTRYKLNKRVVVNTGSSQINNILLYNYMPTIPVFEKIYKCMFEDGYEEYAEEFRIVYIKRLKEKHKELLTFLKLNDEDM